jgi:hypothetical protein
VSPDLAENGPASFVLGQNYPNPFNPSTRISYGLSERTHIRLSVDDLLGREVKELLNSSKELGWHTVPFDASGLAGGIYYYTLKAGSFSETKKMLFMK